MKRPLTVLVATVALAGIAAPAIAAWTTTGGGSGKSAARTLNAPTGGQATSPTTTSLALSWAAPAASTGMGVTYTVTRDGGAASAACTNTTSTSCTDTFASSTTSRTFSYIVTAKVGIWTAASSAFSGTPTTLVVQTQAAPTNFRVQSCTTVKDKGTTTATVTLAWTAASGATSNSLRQGSTNPPTGTPVTINNNTTMTQQFTTTATTNYYSIVATGSAGNSSPVVIGPLTVSDSGANGTCTPPA